MNIVQLEEILRLIKKIGVKLEEDPVGDFSILTKLGVLELSVREELRELVWKRYLKEASP